MLSITTIYLIWYFRLPILMEKVSNGDYIREGPIWDSLSPESHQFIASLLCVDPLTRITSQEALHHPWFI
jgi:serine/threonine protein kinase